MEHLWSQPVPFRLPDAPARSDLVARYFRALGDPIWLRILGLLRARRGAVSRCADPSARPSPAQGLQPPACLRWCGFVITRRGHRVVFYRLADQHITAMLDLAQGLLDDNAGHVAACCRIPEA